MEPPSKRLRLDSSHRGDDDDEENQDELSMTSAQFSASQDPAYQFDKGRAKAATRLKSSFEDIFNKYGKDFGDDGDLVNWYTDEIEVDNGHVHTMEARLASESEGSLSSDEEERILSGKSGGRRKRPKSQLKSLVTTSHTKHKSPSPWNIAAGPGTYRLSSLAFSPSTYNANPPFHFGPSPSQNGPIDPMWQAPDLPIQPRHDSLIGATKSQSDPFGAPPHQVIKRLVTAKSFLLRAASTSSTANDSDVEEDDILLGEHKQNNSPITRSPVPEKTRIPVTSGASLTQPNQSNGQQPPFYGIDVTENGLRDQTDNLRKGSIQEKNPEPLISETFSASHQPAEEHPQLHQTAGTSRSISPSPPKREQPKKSDAHKCSTLHNEEPESETRLLQPHERRIEVIIPTMKPLLPAETKAEQVAEETTPPVNEITQELYIEQEVSIDESGDVPHSQDSQQAAPSTNSHENLVFQTVPDSSEEPQDATAECTAQTFESSMNTPISSAFQNRTLEQIEPPIAHTSLQDEQGLENIEIDISQEPMSIQIAADNSIDEFVDDGLHQTEQEPSCGSENDRVALYQQHFTIADVGIDEERATCDTSMEQIIETTLIDEQIHEVTCRSPSPTSDPTTIESVVSEIAISQDDENKDLPRDEPNFASGNSCGEESLPIQLHILSDEAPRCDDQSDEEFGISEILTSREARISAPEQDVGSRISEHPAIRETTESDSHPGKDCLSLTPEPLGTCQSQDHDLSNQPLFSNALIAEINSLQLDSEPQDTQRSPTPRATELPDKDLSVFPAESELRSTPEPVLRLSLRKTQTDPQHKTGIGRCPSPELGTPIGPEIISNATSRVNDSPTPKTPTRRRGPRVAKPQSSHRHSPSSKRFTLSSLAPGGIDDESDDELSIAGSFSTTISRLNSPFSRTNINDNIELPPLLSTPRKATRRFGLLTGSAFSARTPNRILGLDGSGNKPPATDSRADRSRARRGRNHAVHSSPLARSVAERLLSSPTKRYRATPKRTPSLVASPHGTLRRCGEDGFVCDRDFCLTCCK